MKIYFNLQCIPELQNLTAEQRRGVIRRFFGARYGARAGLAGGVGFLAAFALSSALDFSSSLRLAVTVVVSLLAGVAYQHHTLKRLRPEIADYAFIRFRQKAP